MNNSILIIYLCSLLGYSMRVLQQKYKYKISPSVIVLRGDERYGAAIKTKLKNLSE